MTRMVLTLLLLLATTLIQADVLLIEQVRQADNMSVPENGQTQAEVEALFGAPLNKGQAVGNPPITQWEYEHWSVYFEHQIVLFTVLHKGEVIKAKAPDAR